MTQVATTDMTLEEAHEFIAYVRNAQRELPHRIRDAWQRRAWLALGYPTWDAMCIGERIQLRGLPRDERQEMVLDLRSAGMSTRAIGSALGTSEGTVRKSYQLPGDRAPAAHDRINTAFQASGEVRAEHRADLLKRAVLPSIAEANRRYTGYGNDRLSLAIIHPLQAELHFEHNPSSPDSPQPALFDLPDGAPIPTGAKRFPYLPKIWFRDADGPHDLSLRDWGTFELMRKHGNLVDMSEGERRSWVTRALPGRLGPDTSLLVGNQANARTAWLVIAVLNGLRDPQPTLLDQLEGAAA